MPGKIAAKANPFKSNELVNKCVFVVGPTVATVANVGMTFKTANGRALAVRACVDWYISDSATGSTLASAPSAAAIGTNGLLIEQVNNSSGILTTSATGLADVNITATGTTLYFVVKMPDGSILVSPAIVFP